MTISNVVMEFSPDNETVSHGNEPGYSRLGTKLIGAVRISATDEPANSLSLPNEDHAD